MKGPAPRSGPPQNMGTSRFQAPRDRGRSPAQALVPSSSKRAAERPRSSAPPFSARGDRERSDRPRMDHNKKSAESQPKARVRATRTVQASKASLHQSGIPSGLKDQLSSTDNLTIRPEDSIKFASPTLLPGLEESVKDLIGKDARPTPIQALSLAHFATSPEEGRKRRRTRETLLASETGSGKSMAYLLPVIQGLKATEGTSATEEAASRPKIPNPNVVSGPRAIIICPTHELSRQITTYAKALCHNVKLRIVCASNPNAARGSSKSGNWDATISPEGVIPGFGGRTVDILIGTPATILSLIGGKELGDRKAISAVRRLDQEGEDEVGPRMSLERLEWLVIDEADVMFDRSFIETTQAILEDAAAQNRHAEIPHLQANLILSSATIPLSLSKFLDAHFPRIVRLASPRVHRLPKRLKTEYVQLTDGNKNASIFKKIETVWAEDAQARQAGRSTQKSKIVIFANETKAARRLADYLKQKGAESLVMSQAAITVSYNMATTGPAFFWSIVDWVYSLLTRIMLAILAAGPMPKHICFVMDGNRRYARSHSQRVQEGHTQGFYALHRILDVCLLLNIRCVSVYAFAIENFKRPEEEVTALMDLAKTKLIEMTQKGELLDRNGVRVNIIGRREMLPHDVQEVAKRVEDMTRHHTK
ncbi:RNA helicase [Tulasnella sp. 408]|nr:RNA helicase [Tulasnella sp. 408]